MKIGTPSIRPRRIEVLDELCLALAAACGHPGVGVVGSGGGSGGGSLDFHLETSGC